jgi:membrane protease subunit HflK
MREVVGKSRIQPILTEERLKVAQEVQKLVQETLDRYKAGIVVTEVQLLKSDPPAEVIEAFRAVQAARLEKETLQNQASAYANKSINEAKGEAERILQGAEGYKQQTVAEATGQTSRFNQVYEEYKKAPDVTRQRMFLETMERVMGGTDKIILDSKGGQGVVPFLPLDQLQRRTPAPATGGN